MLSTRGSTPRGALDLRGWLFLWPRSVRWARKLWATKFPHSMVVELVVDPIGPPPGHHCGWSFLGWAQAAAFRCFARDVGATSLDRPIEAIKIPNGFIRSTVTHPHQIWQNEAKLLRLVSVRLSFDLWGLQKPIMASAVTAQICITFEGLRGQYHAPASLP
jgi:hypothetical protein